MAHCNYCNEMMQYDKQRGLTLLEILIALAIISIALTAVIKAMGENIQATAYLETKTAALFLGKEKMNEAKLNLIRLPFSPGYMKTTVDYFNHVFDFEGQLIKTRNPNINAIKIRVFLHQQSAYRSPLVTLDSYRYGA